MVHAEAELEFETEFSKDKALVLVRNCVTSIADTKLFADFLVRRSLAATEATIRVSICVADEAQKKSRDEEGANKPRLKRLG